MKQISSVKTKETNNKKVNNIQIEEKVVIENIIEELKKQQADIEDDKSPWKNLIFDWINIKEGKVNLLSENRIYEWLYPINFSKFSAIIIETINWNIDNILDDREETLNNIAIKMRTPREVFFKELASIQEILIIQNRAKVCVNGQVIIMNQIWEERAEVTYD